MTFLQQDLCKNISVITCCSDFFVAPKMFGMLFAEIRYIEVICLEVVNETIDFCCDSFIGISYMLWHD